MADIENRVSALEKDVEYIKDAIESFNTLPETPGPVNVTSPMPLRRAQSQGGFGILPMTRQVSGGSIPVPPIMRQGSGERIPAPPMMRQGSGGTFNNDLSHITGSGRRSRRRKNKKGLKRRKTQQRRS